MSAFVSFDRFDDIDAQAEQLVGFDQHYQQIEPGRYAGAFLTHDVPDLSIAIEQTNRALHQEGAGPAGQVSAVFLMEAGSHLSRVNGQHFTADDVLLVTEGGSYETVISAGAIPAVVSLPAALLAGSNPADDIDTGRVRHARNAGLAAELRSLLFASVPGLQPSRSAEAGPTTEARSRDAARALMNRLRGDASGYSERSHETFRWARSILVDDIAADISVAELARAVGVSRRTLDTTFRASAGVSPARFKKLLRLNHARRLIESGDHSIATAASLSGLHHFGRFSRDYREHFGELPSSTLARTR